MNDNRLSQMLQSLPREKAGADFTARVRRRLETRTASLFPPARWPVLAAAAAAVVLALGLGWREWRQDQAQQATVARLEPLLEETQALEEELLTLRRLTAAARPVVYLGGTEEVDLVLDLARLHQRRVSTTGTAAPYDFSPADVRITPPKPRSAVY